MKAKEIRQEIKNCYEQINEAQDLKAVCRPGTIGYDAAMKVIEVKEEEVEMLEKLLQEAQAGGEII